MTSTNILAQRLYRAANGLKVCPDCGGRWIPANQECCFPCAQTSVCGDPNCGCAK
jgi:hypothetical protein